MANVHTGFLAYVIAAREVRASNVIRKCLMLYYASNTNEHGAFFKPLLHISIDTGISESTIQRLNAEWEKLGILTWKSGDASKANQYQLHLPVLRKFVESSKVAFDQKHKLRLERDAARAKKYRDSCKKKN